MIISASRLIRSFMRPACSNRVTKSPPITCCSSPKRVTSCTTVWFAPQVTMTGVFTGTLAISLGLGFWLGLLAMVIGTTLGSVIVGYLSTWGPRTGAGQLPIARMAFGGAVVLPAGLQWVSSIAWDALVGSRVSLEGVGGDVVTEPFDEDNVLEVRCVVDGILPLPATTGRGG